MPLFSVIPQQSRLKLSPSLLKNPGLPWQKKKKTFKIPVILKLPFERHE